MNVLTRFAPSPTGLLHVGNLRMALINYLLAQKLNGKFILRIDDTDLERSKKEYELAIKEDLNWLNLTWDYTFNQSDNIATYDKYLQSLKDQGLIYACYETREELEYKRKLQLARGAPPIYDRSSLHLTKQQIDNFEKEGRKPYYRFKLLSEDVVWQDLVKGAIKIQADHLSDPILIKENGGYLYSFSSVVDDIEHKITHIIRGEDHISNTAMHIQLFKCLGCKPPLFGHMSLLSLLDGGELSKRTGSNSVRDLRNQGIHKLAILNYLFMLGQTEHNYLYSNLPEMVHNFDLNYYSKSLVKFDNNKLLQINALILQSLSFDEVLPELENLHINDVNSELWNLYKNNINTLLDIVPYNTIIYGEASYTTDDPVLIQTAINLLPEQEFTTEVINSWLVNIKHTTGLNNKHIFTVLRQALTGDRSGPNFKDLIFVMGKEKVKARLLRSL